MSLVWRLSQDPLNYFGKSLLQGNAGVVEHTMEPELKLVIDIQAANHVLDCSFNITCGSLTWTGDGCFGPCGHKTEIIIVAVGVSIDHDLKKTIARILQIGRRCLPEILPGCRHCLLHLIVWFANP